MTGPICTILSEQGMGKLTSQFHVYSKRFSTAKGLLKRIIARIQQFDSHYQKMYNEIPVPLMKKKCFMICQLQEDICYLVSGVSVCPGAAQLLPMVIKS